MSSKSLAVLSCAILVAAWVLCSTLVYGQAAPGTTISASDAQDAAKRAIIESPRWQQMRQRFDHWLAIQRIYTADEMTAIQADFNARIAQMSPQQVEQFLKDMEDRLDVLTSASAEEARRWVAQFAAVVRNPEQRIREKRPDVMNMTAGQIRQELDRFHQEQASRQQAQSAFNRTRAMQVESAQGVQSSRQQALGHAQESRSQAAANAPVRSPYAPRPQDLPNYTDFSTARSGYYAPVYTVGPWGQPIRWNPWRYGWW